MCAVAKSGSVNRRQRDGWRGCKNRRADLHQKIAPHLVLCRAVEAQARDDHVPFGNDEAVIVVVTRSAIRVRRCAGKFALAGGLDAVHPPVETILAGSAADPLGETMRQLDRHLHARGFVHPALADELLAFPVATIQKQQAKPGRLARGDSHRAAFVARTAVDQDAIHRPPIAPIPFRAIHPDRIGDAAFEQFLQRLAGDVRQHVGELVHR